jgi:hypothetical protein
VCYCGGKLSEIVTEDDGKIVYKCGCGKEVDIKKSICIETTRLHRLHEINIEEGK